MNEITICFSYYENPRMLELQYKHLRKIPDDLKRSLRLIVVDDGTGASKARPDGSLIPGDTPSAVEPAKWQDIGFPYELYRMTVDIRWNQDACRNLAADRAQTDWILLTDIDHILPSRTLDELVSGTFASSKAYKFVRTLLQPDKKIYPFRIHQNTWFLFRKTFWEVGGYDEILRGKYGSDGDICRRIEQHCGQPVILPYPICLVTPRTVRDAATFSYTRKDPILDANIAEILTKRDSLPDWKPMIFRTPWERVR